MSYESAVSKLGKRRDPYGENSSSKEQMFLFPEDFHEVSGNWAPKAPFPQLEELRETLDEEDILIAGGAVLGSYAAISFNDIDLFPLNKGAADEAREFLRVLGYKVQKEEAHAEYYNHAADVYRPVQLIRVHTDTGSPYQVLRRFDLTLCQIGLYKGRMISFERSMKDIKDRIIRVNMTVSVDNMIKRIEKYKGRGFRVFDEQEERK